MLYQKPLSKLDFESDSDDPSLNVRVKAKSHEPARQIRALLAVIENPRSARWAINEMIALFDKWAAEGFVTKQYSIRLLINTRGRYGEKGDGLTPLIAAVVARDVGAAAVFLLKGAKVDRRDRRLGYSPLMWAVSSRGNGEMVKLLLQNGASVSFHGFDKHTPLSLALTRGLRDEASRCVICAPMKKWMKLWRPVFRMRLLMQNAHAWVMMPRSSQLLGDDTVFVDL